MNAQRARAHARVTKMVREVGPAKLLPSEQSRIRATVDALVFCDEIVTDAAARAAFSDVIALCEHLVATGRWTPRSADDLADEIWACGPSVEVALRHAA